MREARPTLASASSMRLALGGVEAAVAQRHVDVVEQRQVGDQVEALEDEAQLFIAQARAGVVVHAFDVDAVEDVLAVGEFFQQAGDVEEAGLAGAGRAGDGDEFACLTSISKPRSACVSIMWVR
jgi:hypothetical protein